MKSCDKSRKSSEKSKNEILKLKELPNERLEGSWGALWLGIRTFSGFKLGAVGFQGEGKSMKSQKTAQEGPRKRPCRADLRFTLGFSLLF